MCDKNILKCASLKNTVLCKPDLKSKSKPKILNAYLSKDLIHSQS